MLNGCCAHLFVAVAKRDVLVNLVLKEIWVDCSNSNPVFFGELHYFGSRLARAKIPEHVNGHGRTNTGERVHLSRIGELVIDVDSGGVLGELTKARAGIGEA